MVRLLWLQKLRFQLSYCPLMLEEHYVSCLSSGVLVKIRLVTDHESLKAAVQPVDLHIPASVVHCPADVPTHGVEQAFFSNYFVPFDSFPSVLKTLNFYHNGNASHSAQMLITRAVDRD